MDMLKTIPVKTYSAASQSANIVFIGMWLPNRTILKGIKLMYEKKEEEEEEEERKEKKKELL